MPYTYERLKGEYQRRWDAMVINSNRRPLMEREANKIIQGRPRYEILQRLTGIPWYFIGMLHLRESNCNFNRHLHNGDPLSGKTYHVPAGRIPGKSPPYTFEVSALDALGMQGFLGIKDWTIAQIAFRSEIFNGFGYRNHGVPSAYLWAGTSEYRSGKYVSDGVFDPNVVDVQQGCMGILKVILEKTNAPVAEENLEEVAVAAPKAIPDAPTPKVLNKASRKYYWNDWLQWVSGIFGGGAATLKAVDVAQIQATKTWVDSFKQFANDYGLLFMFAVIIALIAFAMYQKSLIKEDVVEGRYIPSKDEKKDLEELKPAPVEIPQVIFKDASN